MRILTANLKHYYQRRFYWLVWLFIGFVLYGYFKDDLRGSRLDIFNFVFLPSLIGVVLSWNQLEVLSKPFVFCLPGYRGFPRKLILLAGFVSSFIFSLKFCFYPWLNITQGFLVFLSSVSLFLVFYWLGVLVAFRFKNWVGFLFVLPVWLMLLIEDETIELIDEYVFISYPIVTVIIGLIVSCLAWIYLGGGNISRRYCGTLQVGFFDIFNRSKASKIERANLAKRDKSKFSKIRISDKVEAFFVGRILKQPAGNAGRYIWGVLYKTFGVTISCWRQSLLWFFLFILPLLCIVGYTDRPTNSGMNFNLEWTVIFIFPVIIFLSRMKLSLYSSMLIAGGRRERFWSTFVMVVAGSIIMTLLLMFVVTVTILLEGVLPVVTIKGGEYVFYALDMRLSFAPLLLIPVIVIIDLLFYRHLLLTFFIIIAICAFLTFSIDMSDYDWAKLVGPLQVGLLMLCSWLVFIAVLGRVVRRRCLVG